MAVNLTAVNLSEHYVADISASTVCDVSNVNTAPMFCFVSVALKDRMSDPAVTRVVSDIIRSPEDKREYRGLEFNNGLKAILISDPTTDKSSAALDVHIGKEIETKIQNSDSGTDQEVVYSHFDKSFFSL